MLFHQDNSKNSTFEDLEPKVIPIFLLERSISIKGYSIQRKQALIYPVFSLTNYKVQGSTLTTVVLDLKHDPSAKGQDHHKKFCLTYVQLSQLRSLNRLYLLQSITIEDLQFCLDN